ncbi:hypothetical protein HO133_003331 [Letharia lupina]|uniref:protein-histidine N-methyltransferase n=1 Tax=Letharia lupina TaxID=560253 RepID=A0A8H6CAX2_9LECA|nr:uncharacterized protein HO133_003331 [Letharia lupina]KAF6220200.1 hypothetical protein HO133_003331 [Letharia lupina]
MSQSFSFGFGSDDIEENGGEMADVGPLSLHDTRENKPVAVTEPKLHKLQDLLSALPSKISYRTVQIRSPAGILNVPRRELFDIRAQLMAEDEISDQSSPVVGLSTDDITPNVYEGGFKTWECAVDLAGHLFGSLSKGWELGGRVVHVVEVGAGTALPILVFFDFFLKQLSPSWRAVHLSVADYNLSVLANATLPNLLLTWYFVQSPAIPEPAGDLEITPDLLSRFVKDLSDKVIHISGISGTWNEAFTDLLLPVEDPQRRSRIETIFLASETIYSPNSIHAFTQVLLKALKSAEETHGHGRALVAAKKIYFGVGGGVDEFLKVLNELGGKGATAWESKDEGVGRVIVEVQSAGGNAAKR